MAVDEHSGICKICAKPADAALEDCHLMFCTAGCNREGGDLYHSACLKKFIASGAKGTARHIPKIPYSNFPCPKGKGKGSEGTPPCKGVAAHCKRVIVKAEQPAPVPQVLVQNEKWQKKPKPPPGNKPAALPNKPAKPKAPPVSDFTRVRLPPVPAAPKPDSLGRNLNGASQQELPPGYVDEAQAAADKAKQAKASKKNQKRTAKRREEAGSQWDTSSANGSTTDTSGMPPLEEVLGPGAVEAEGSVASGGRFITDIDRYHALLAKHMDYSDSDIEYATDDEDDAASGQPTPWTQQQQQQPHAGHSADAAEWQSVGARGRAPAPAAPPASASGSAAGAPAGATSTSDEAEALRRQEEEQLRAALEASLNDGSVGAAAARVQAAQADDDYEAALERAMRESLAAEEAQRQRQKEEQAALLAAFQARTQQQQQQPRAHMQEPAGAVGADAGWGTGPVAVDDSSAGWGAGASSGAATAAAAWGVQSQPQQQLSQQQQQQAPPGYSNSHFTAVAPAAGNPYAAVPAAVPSAAVPPPSAAYTTLQAAYAPTSTPALVTSTINAQAPAATITTTPAAAPAAAYPATAVPQQQVPVPWLQNAGLAKPAMPAGYGGAAAAPAASFQAAPAAAAPAATPAAAAGDDHDDDDDLGSLLALLNV